MRALSVVALATMLSGCGPERPPANGGPPPSPTSAPASAETRHPEAVALLTGYTLDDGAPGAAEDEVIEALLTLQKAHSEAPLSEEERKAVFDLFVRFEVAKPKAKHKGLFRVLNNVVVDVADPSWETKLVGMLEVQVASMRKAHLEAVSNQVFWQVTACEVLGKMRAHSAIVPLVKVILSPLKGNIAGTAMFSLSRIGAPVIPVATRLVEGKDAALASFAKSELERTVLDQGETMTPDIQQQADNAGVEHGLMILSNIGTKAAAKPILAALKSPTLALRQQAASELHKLPKSPELIASFKRVYAEAGINDKLLNGAYAKEELLQSGMMLFEPGLVAWMVDDALKLTGAGADVVGVQAGVLSAALRSCRKSEWPKVMALYEALKAKVEAGKAEEWARYAEAREGAEAVLKSCGDDAACYAKILEGPADVLMKWLRSAHMVSLLGDAATVSSRVQMMLSHESPDVCASLGKGLLARSPDGNPQAADAIDEAIAEARASRDNKRIRTLKPFKIVALVLRARAAK